jgi:hypothetical protein
MLTCGKRLDRLAGAGLKEPSLSVDPSPALRDPAVGRCMEQILHARNPSEVSSAKVIEADLGVGNRRLLVISGIAIYNWTVDTDEVQTGEVRVMFGVYARELEQASPFVGLASISNEESEFLFATDITRVDLDEETGELSLYVQTNLQGERSGFNRFAYQVVATVVHTSAFIEGTIAWPTSLMRPPSDDPSTVAPYFKVVANHREMTDDPYFQPTEKLTPVTPPAAIQSLGIEGDRCVARYRIDNPPMGMELKVTATVQPGFVPSGPVSATQVSGPDNFILSPQHVSETVDFVLTHVVIK